MIWMLNKNIDVLSWLPTSFLHGVENHSVLEVFVPRHRSPQSSLLLPAKGIKVSLYTKSLVNGNVNVMMAKAQEVHLFT